MYDLDTIVALNKEATEDTTRAERCTDILVGAAIFVGYAAIFGAVWLFT